MAIFCVVLATAAFLLTAMPQACRCDRSDQRDGNDLALRAMLSNDNGLEGNIWQSIRERFMNGDGNNNLISSAKPAHDIPSNPSESMMLLESLINRYRKYVVERFVRFDDACSVVLFGGETAANDDTVDNELRSETSRTRVASIGLLEGSPGKGSGDASNQLQREGSMEQDLCSRSAKQYYRCLMERFNDQQLIGMLQDHLETYCFRRGDLSAALQKRDTPRYVSKQKFHSWGGKRNTAQVFYPWGGKRTVPRPHKQPKVVIRNPFHSWGGKRSGLAIDSPSV